MSRTISRGRSDLRASATDLRVHHVAKKDLGWSDEVYRGVTSAKGLDEEGFDRVIKHAKALGFWIKRKFEQERPRDAGDLPTPAQLKVIEHLKTDLAEYVPGMMQTKFWRGFLQKRVGISGLGPQTRAQANHLIEVLKQRVEREMRKSVE
jgi:hypothetical protein